MSKTAIIVADDGDYYFKSIVECSVVPILGKRKKISLWLCKHFPSIVINKLIKCLESERFDTIIIFDMVVRYLPELPFSIKKLCKKMVFYSWNMIGKNDTKLLNVIPVFDCAFSFSKNDCKKYGFFYLPLMARRISPSNKPKDKIDLLFLGYEKNRFDTLMNLREKVFSLNYRFYIVTNKRHDSLEGVVFSKKKVSYHDYIEQLVNSSCILDVPNEKQDGYTLRVAEAIVYEKKIITTCNEIKKDVFFNPNMIFVINEHTTTEQIKTFLNLPRTRYTNCDAFFFQNWINIIVNKVYESSQDFCRN